MLRAVGLLAALTAAASWASATADEKPTVKPATKTAATKTAPKKPASLVSTLLFGEEEVEAVDSTPPEKSTFERAKNVRVSGPSGNLVSISAGPNGTVVALTGPGRDSVPMGRGKAKKTASDLTVFDATGKKLASWTLSFVATAIGVTPAGEILAAGGGRIAKYAADGKELTNVEAPFVAELLKDEAKLKKQAEARRDQMVQLYENQVKIYKKQIADAKKAERAPPRNSEMMLKSYERVAKEFKDRPLDSFVGEIKSALGTVNSIAATKDRVFLTCREATGYGFAVWRMDGTDFANAKQVMKGLSGCCGQMDVQCCDDCLYIAENTKHRVGVYNHEGKPLRNFGRNDRTSKRDGFGSCCNPMNTFRTTNGDVYTAESEGFVKRFDKDGKFVELLAAPGLSGGCKNVALAVSSDGATAFLLDSPNSQFIVFAKKKPVGPSAN